MKKNAAIIVSVLILVICSATARTAEVVPAAQKIQVNCAAIEKMLQTPFEDYKLELQAGKTFKNAL